MKRTALVMLLMLLSGTALAGEPAKPKSTPKPAAPATELTSEAALLLARQRIVAKDYAGAEAVLRDASKRFPEAHGIHLMHAQLEEARGNVRAALWEYQWELLRAGGDRPSGAEAARRSSVLVESGTKDALRVKRVLEAMAAAGTAPDAALEAVVEERSSLDSFVLRVFETELRASDGDAKSADAFRSLIAIDPRFVPAHIGLARALGRAGKMPEAEAALAKAREIDPSHWSIPR